MNKILGNIAFLTEGPLKSVELVVDSLVSLYRAMQTAF